MSTCDCLNVTSIYYPTHGLSSDSTVELFTGEHGRQFRACFYNTVDQALSVAIPSIPQVHLTNPLRLSNHYGFIKPNDINALNLMNEAAKGVMTTFSEVCIAYGVSDEYSFVFEKSTVLFERRTAKLVTTLVSTFTAFYVHLWSKFMDGRQLDMAHLPGFDGRAVCYPDLTNLRDYLSWRQVDCHINNLYNTTFWALVLRGGMTPTAAEEELKGTVAADKNEILFSRFGINYNAELEIFRKGSVVFRDYGHTGVLVRSFDGGGATGVSVQMTKTQAEKTRRVKAKADVKVEHVDIIKDDFWAQRPWILGCRDAGT